jgi:undecaprenyl diphosphate synthase
MGDSYTNIPVHVGIIMDGNGRWAKKRFLPRTIGHKAGTENVRNIVKHSKKRGIKYLTLYAFSNENWKRSSEEVGTLMDLFTLYIKNELNELTKEGVKLNFIGDLSGLPNSVLKQIELANKTIIENKSLTLSIAINYGSRTEIINAVNTLLLSGVDKIDEDSFKNYLYTKEIPDPDLIIRTSGEQRLSNFLLYQSAYSEFYFTDVLWPDFDEKEYDIAIDDYSKRQRRYGGY